MDLSGPTMPMYHDLRGKRVLVTGASSGIGKACARAFLNQGSLVALHHHSGSVRDLLSDFPGDVALALQGDLATEDACTSAIASRPMSSRVARWAYAGFVWIAQERLPSCRRT